MDRPRFEPGHLQNIWGYPYKEEMINQQWRQSFNWQRRRDPMVNVHVWIWWSLREVHSNQGGQLKRKTEQMHWFTQILWTNDKYGALLCYWNDTVGKHHQQAVFCVENRIQLLQPWQELSWHMYLVPLNTLFNSDWCLPITLMFNPLKTKRRLLYLKTQFVPRSKHFSSRL